MSQPPKRKDTLKALFGAAPEDTAPKSAQRSPSSSPSPNQSKGQAAAQETVSPQPAQPQSAQPQVVRPLAGSSGAVRAMGLQLDQLKAQIHNTHDVQSIDTQLIEHAPISDRLAIALTEDDGFQNLVENIRDHGQQVPVLLRPHPQRDGHYQSAYGHRRIEACRLLERPVKALIATLSDAELLLAQGQENAGRRDLSFIERALFAQSILDAGHDRATVMAALGVHKSELSRLLQVAQIVPRHIVKAIGAAPKVGRPRWLALGEILSSPAKVEIASDALSSEAFQSATSDQRFALLFERLQRRAKPKGEGVQKLRHGKITLGHVKSSGTNTQLQFSKDSPDGFAEFVISELGALFETFERQKNQK